jgi:hypothetical protein
MYLIPSFIERRIEIILAEACIEKTARQDIKMMMRVISNFATVGKDVGTQAIYKSNPYLSNKAKNALEMCNSFVEWVGTKKKNLVRRVTSEHQYPLQEFWIEIRKNINNYNSESIWKMFCEYPMVSILVEEDAELRKKKYKGLSPHERYLEAGIEVVKLNAGAYSYWNAMHLSKKSNNTQLIDCISGGADT